MAKPFLDVLRKDQAMSRDYDPGAARIDVPILALAGRDDRMTSASELADWKSYTSKSVSVEWLDGQHYFPLDQPSRVALHVQRFGEFRDQP